MPTGRTSGWLAVLMGAAGMAAFVAMTPPLCAAAKSVEPLVFSALFVLSFIGLGLPVARRFVQGGVGQALTALALGIGATGALTLALGLLGMLRPLPFAIWLVLGWALLLVFGRPLLPRSLPSLHAWNAWGAAIVLLFLAALLPFVVAPEASTDALSYHLLIPKTYLERGAIVRLPGFVESDYPCLAEYVYLPALLLFDDEIVCKGMHFFVALAALAATSLLSRKISPETPAMLAPALVLSMPVVAIHMGWAWNDFHFVLFLMLCLCAIVDHLQSSPGTHGTAVLAGLMLGLASFTKYTFLLYLLPLSALAIWALWRRLFRPAHLMWFGAAFLAVASTWIAKNWAFTGNPVYPFLSGVFPTAGWTATNAAFFRDANVAWEMPGWTWLHYLLFPITLPLLHPIVENQTGVIPILALPLLARRLRGDAGNLLRLYAFLTAIAWSTLFHSKSRSLLALFALGLALAAAAIHEIPAAKGILGRALMGILTTVCVVNLMMTMVVTHHLFDPMAYFFGRETRGQYLSRMAMAQKAFDVLNATPSAGRVALIGIQEPYYLDKPYIFSSFSDTPVALTLARSAPSAHELAASMRRDGFSHVVMALGALDDPDRKPLYTWTPEERQRFEQFLRDECHRVLLTDDAEVFEIRAPMGPALP